MDLLMVLIALVGIAVSIANKKNAQKGQNTRQAEQGRGNPAPRTATPSAPNRRQTTKAPTASYKFPPVEKKPQTVAQKKPLQPAVDTYGGTPRYTHVVTSTLEGGHTHTESSMTGEESCPPPKVAAATAADMGKTAPADTGNPLLAFTKNGVLQGVMYAEILGKPKALQGK